MMRWAFCLALLAAAQGHAASAQPRIVASCLPVYCFAANVAGRHATVDTLISGGISPHDYHFSPQDLSKLQEAQLLLILGLGFEPWAGRVRKAVTTPVVEIASGLGPHLIHDGACDHGHAPGTHHHPTAGEHANPHVWLDPQLAIICVSNVLGALRQTDPGRAAAYETNAVGYIQRLRSLDKQMAAALEPLAGAAVIAYHDALPYFARRYGLKVAAVVQPAPEVNPSLRRLAELRRTVRDKKVKALLVDANSQTPLAERISREFQIPLVPFDILETGKISAGAYEEAMRDNVAALTRALR